MSGCSMDLACSILGVQYLLVYGLPPPFVPMRPRPTRCSSLAARPISPPTTMLLLAAVTENPLSVVEPMSAPLHSFLCFAISANLAHSQVKYSQTYIFLPLPPLVSSHPGVAALDSAAASPTRLPCLLPPCLVHISPFCSASTEIINIIHHPSALFSRSSQSLFHNIFVHPGEL